MPVRDANLDLSPAATDLPLINTNVLSAASADIKGTPLSGMAVRLDYAYTTDNTAALTLTLNVIVHAASSTPVASSDPIVGHMDEPIILSSESLTTGQKIIPFVTELRYVTCEYAMTTADTDSPAFSKVEAFIVEGVGLEWDRTTRWG